MNTKSHNTSLLIVAMPYCVIARRDAPPTVHPLAALHRKQSRL